MNLKLKETAASIGILMLVAALVYLLFSQLQQNLASQNIATGFDFLSYEAGFEISESLINYDSFASYKEALFVGFLNTLKMSILGCMFAFFIGLLFGVLGVSQKKAVKGLSDNYINITRNIPLLLQLFFWYALFTDIFPSVKQARPWFGMLFTNRGFYISFFESNLVGYLFVFSLALILFFIGRVSLTKIKRYRPYFFVCATLVSFISLTITFSNLFSISSPKLSGFNINGGVNLSPEFCSLFLGLTIYTGAFMAEIIRSGILSINQGQWEAARSLGLNELQVLRFIIIPQSFKVSLPPLISQFLNLAKNSSLAVAIGYPDFVSIANTSMNQTGQAIELVLLIMIMYLGISLSSSFTLNLIGRKKSGQ